MSYLAIFAADDPNANTALVYYIILSIWAYPAFVIVGYRWGHYKRNKNLISVVLKTNVPLLSAMWYPLIGMIGYGISDALITTEDERIALELQKKYDPIFEDRFERIKRRNPIEDAQEAMQRKEIALLPSGLSPETGWFRGLEKYETDKIDLIENYRRINESEFLSELHELVWDDKDDVDPTGAYFSPVYTKFYVASWQYKTAFNETIKPNLIN